MLRQSVCGLIYFHYVFGTVRLIETRMLFFLQGHPSPMPIVALKSTQKSFKIVFCLFRIVFFIKLYLSIKNSCLRESCVETIRALLRRGTEKADDIRNEPISCPSGA